MKSVLISIKPKYCELIASGKKTVELRKSYPKIDTPFKVYIYCTKDEPLYESGEKFLCGEDWGNGKIIGEFVCDGIYKAVTHPDYFAGHPLFFKNTIEAACLTNEEVEKYSSGKDVCGWHISNLVIYDKPITLTAFHKPCQDIKNCLNAAFREAGNGLDKCFDCGCRIKRPPQSWCYVEEKDGANK